MARKTSIQTKYSIIFFTTLVLVIGAFVAGLGTLRNEVLRNEAEAIADQVISFRAWVAGSGMVWVHKLVPGFPDFLAKTEDGHGGFFYGKNPALATRELSVIANKTSKRATFLVTSDDYRQAANKPDAFELQAIRTFKSNRGLKFTETYEEGIYRYARPIFVKKGCLKCHGDPEDAPPAVIQKYGDKKAFGYKVGDIRGIVSVKIPSIGWQKLLPILTNPIVIALVVLAFAINFLFTQRFIIRRLTRLTEDANAIARGKLSTTLDYTPPDRSNDEIDHAYHAVNLLKKSLIIVLKRSRGKK
ncbi:DUF3365 domain-containing protein [Thermodesulfobacteriota bacterium B35]